MGFMEMKASGLGKVVSISSSSSVMLDRFRMEPLERFGSGREAIATSSKQTKTGGYIFPGRIRLWNDPLSPSKEGKTKWDPYFVAKLPIFWTFSLFC